MGFILAFIRFSAHLVYLDSLTFSYSTGLALNYILQNNFKANVGMRPNSRKIGVLVTKGKSQDDILVNSQNLRDQDIELYAIGKNRFPFRSFRGMYISAGDLLTTAQIKEHRRNISFTYRPMQYTKCSAN